MGSGGLVAHRGEDTRLSEGPGRHLGRVGLAYHRGVRSKGSRRSGSIPGRAAAAVAVAFGTLAGALAWSGSADGERTPLPAGPHPSAIAKEPCQAWAQEELAAALGLKGTVTDRTWVDHRFSCNYVYSTGTFTLSIQELSSWDQTYAYFHKLGRQLGDIGKLGNLGQGAFQTSDGSVVVRKDWKVLLVNVASLPPNFGVPPTLTKYIAVTIADVILDCWAGD